MKTGNTTRVVAVYAMSCLAATASPVFAQEHGVGDEILRWQKRLAEEILTNGDSAAHAMASEIRKQTHLQLRQQTGKTLERLSVEMQNREDRYTRKRSPKKTGGMAAYPLYGSRSAAVIEDSSLSMRVIP